MQPIFFENININMKKILVVAICLLSCPFIVKADTWLLPETKKYCSQNKKFCLKVEPKKLESQLSYFQDKVNNRENAGADKKLAENFCKGTFYAKGKKLWKVKLDNEVAPVEVLVSNNGDYVITFDNWHGTGYGDNVVAIYETSTGKLLRKVGLEDFLTDSDIYNLPHSVSSIKWSGEHQIDYVKKNLVLKVVKPSKNRNEFFDVRIDLVNGKVLDEKIDRLPSLQFLLETKDSFDVSELKHILNEENSCSIQKNFLSLKPSELLSKVLYKEIPKYPPAAKAVRATGLVIINVIISENGDVECVKTFAGHPLLRAILQKAVSNWKFEKHNTKLAGQIIFSGKSALVLNGKIIEEQ
jgi:Gram-negative bacterial TonB protein C-terminal